MPSRLGRPGPREQFIPGAERRLRRVDSDQQPLIVACCPPAGRIATHERGQLISERGASSLARRRSARYPLGRCLELLSIPAPRASGGFSGERRPPPPPAP